MSDFVLDENVYIRALKSEETEAPLDKDAARLVHCLQVRHTWVLSAEVLIAYYRQFAGRVIHRGVIAHELLASLKLVLFDSTRHTLIHDPAPVVGAFDQDDSHVVNAASARSNGVILITLDERLRNDLLAAGVPQAHGFRLADVGAALQELCN